MGLFSWILAGAAGAIINSIISDNRKPTQTVYYVVNNTNKSNNNKFNELKNFMESYNLLKSACDSVFGKDQYNSVKKLANAIKFNSRKDDYKMQGVVNKLYDVVNLRNKYISHCEIGIGAIPNNDYVIFMNNMRKQLLNNKEACYAGYRKFCEYKDRKRLGY